MVVGVRRSVGASQMLAAKGVPATSSNARDQFIRAKRRVLGAAQARVGVGDHVPQHGALEWEKHGQIAGPPLGNVECSYTKLQRRPHLPNVR